MGGSNIPDNAGLEERIALVVQAMNNLVGIVARVNTHADLDVELRDLRAILEAWLQKWD